MPRKPAPRRPGKPPFKPRGKTPFGKAGPARGKRPSPPPPRPHADQTPADGEPQHAAGERLQKVLAAAGIASRRECEELITEGRVQVDGEIVNQLGARVDRARQEILVDGEPLPRPRLVYFAINKPTGVVTTARDPAGRPRVIDLLPPSVGRVFTVGRLDLASEGLILATNDGEMANQLAHPKHGIEKTYEVQVAGHPDPEVLVQLRRGVHLAEGYSHAVHARIKSKLKRSTLLEMALDEGRNREVRRLLARIGHKVQRLTRVAVGPIRLGEMPRGAFRQLSQEEVRKLREAIATGPKPKPERDAEPPRRPARPMGVKPRSRKPFAGKSIAGKPSAGKPSAGKRFVRRPDGAQPAQPGGIQRKVVGGDAGGLAGDAAEGGRPPKFKPRFRKAKGTKLTGNKPIKRRRPERPQRGSKKP